MQYNTYKFKLPLKSHKQKNCTTLCSTIFNYIIHITSSWNIPSDFIQTHNVNNPIFLIMSLIVLIWNNSWSVWSSWTAPNIPCWVLGLFGPWTSSRGLMTSLQLTIQSKRCPFLICTKTSMCYIMFCLKTTLPLTSTCRYIHLKAGTAKKLAYNVFLSYIFICRDCQ